MSFLFFRLNRLRLQ